MSPPSDRWLEWQRDHAAALAALQEAQRAYHRTVVGASGSAQLPTASRQPAADGQQPPAVSPQAERLEAVDAARVRLDAVRSRKPE
jgi:hypothetical protein